MNPQADFTQPLIPSYRHRAVAGGTPESVDPGQEGGPSAAPPEALIERVAALEERLGELEMDVLMLIEHVTVTRPKD